VSTPANPAAIATATAMVGHSTRVVLTNQL
jgi:hypothetical protein